MTAEEMLKQFGPEQTKKILDLAEITVKKRMIDQLKEDSKNLETEAGKLLFRTTLANETEEFYRRVSIFKAKYNEDPQIYIFIAENLTASGQ